MGSEKSGGVRGAFSDSALGCGGSLRPVPRSGPWDIPTFRALRGFLGSANHKVKESSTDLSKIGRLAAMDPCASRSGPNHAPGPPS